MNKPILFTVLMAYAISACQVSYEDTEKDKVQIEQITFPQKLAAGTIYEVNIRQHTTEGTIAAFMDDIPRLKSLGVTMLWIMPVQPIGIKNRKLPLGSYYSINDYTAINQEFGTMDDFKDLVNACHAAGMYVILDWVPNHTAWDHPWITENPSYYAKNEDGEIIYEADWTDIALLDHTNPDVRKAMIDAMAYWVTNADIDGFRCDHAGHEIPLYFWEEATARLDSLKDLFWLAEWDGARMHIEFDATYAWELLHLTEQIAKGEANANDLDEWIKNDLKEYGRKSFRMSMITNHDENAWSGTVFERYGQGHKTFATFIFTAYGIPMLYSGQEVGLNIRLKFFDKDTIDWHDPLNLQSFYKQLIDLKTNNPAIWNGAYGEMPKRINNDQDIYGFKRQNSDNLVIGIFNLSGQDQVFHLSDEEIRGEFQDVFSKEVFNLNTNLPITMSPWQYLVFTK